jgi:DNA-binding beta-propeller fold protein YncE
MKLSKLFLFGVLGGLFFNSCSSDDDNVDPQPEPEVGVYSEGLFVLNEGAQAAGTVTYISDDMETVENEIYQANNNDDLGMFLQSMFFHEDNAYIISNGSNLITAVDRNTFEVGGKVDSGLKVPYYAAVVGETAYVTNLAEVIDTPNDDYIALVDLKTLEVTGTIEIDGPASKIIAEDEFVYVQNSSYGVGNTITVINSATKDVVKTIQVNDGLTDMEIENDYLYVLGTGSFETIDLTTGQKVSEVVLTDDLQGASNLEVEDGTAYFTLDNAVYAMAVGATTNPVAPMIEYTSNSQWGKMYGFEVEDDKIYIGDAGDFGSNGFIQVYTTSGEFLKQISVGVAPNGFYFND